MIVKFAAAALVPIVKFAVVTAAVAVAAVPASAARMSAAAVPASADRMSAAGRCRPSVHNIIFRVRAGIARPFFRLERATIRWHSLLAWFS